MPKLLILPGDGPGSEYAEAAGRAVSNASDSVEVVTGDIGFPAYERYGEYLPSETLDLVNECPVAICGPTEPAEDIPDPRSALLERLDLFGRSRRFRTLADGLGTPGTDITVWGSCAGPSGDIAETPDVDGVTVSKYIRSAFYSRMMGAALSDMEVSGMTRAVCIAQTSLFPDSSRLFYDSFDALFGTGEESHMEVGEWLADVFVHPLDYQCVVAADLFLSSADGAAAGLTGGTHLAPTRYVGEDMEVILPGCPEDSRTADPVSCMLSASQALADLGLRDESDRILGAVSKTLAEAGSLPSPEGTPDFLTRVLSRI